MNAISAADLRAWLESDQEELTVLDVREGWEHERARIDGAILVPMAEVPLRLSELPRNGKLVVMCHHGIRSQQVCHFLQRQGFGAVYNLNGGINAWSSEVDPSVPTY